ncbi:SEC-C motif-containing protein [Desulfitobacterium dichloroeliminans LMG P-21439]|uniref:SEC-C motif-containing protein n=1 Tax=Desulfitobacterium dichloroeliminans (strain LMG P-21439 / DCA1) TaxID=871963 RepID=L0F4Z3_DESDL|nr:SEC-C metal-binding domain-containing protein [Desulfitobacterium dichloroeliminans]AGA68904.1 SEC-C motif-containing protein [Desulfitobacterium dichloroeliminans LMG P-21439]
MHLFKNFKIYDDELCPCGSEKLYKYCCKERKDKSLISSKKPPEVQAMERMRKALFKCCLYPDKTKCAKHIKEAHALQNNKIISRLAVDGHVYMLDTKRPPLIIPIENEEPEIITLIDKVGVNHATTSTCFCDVHDDEVFAPIEKNALPFDINNEEHKFLYAYKAFIFEYYKELVLENVFRQNIKEKPSMLKSADAVRQYRNLLLKRKEMDQIKTFFDTALITQNYIGLKTRVVEIPEEIDFANFACVGFSYDLEGHKIKNIKNNIMDRVFLTIFPEENKSYIIMSYLEKDKNTYGNLAEQLKYKDIDLIKYFITLVLPLYSENIVLSPRLWEKWDEETQMAFTFYSNRSGSQFAVYNLAVKFGMQNIKNKKMNLPNGKRCKIDLFS